MDIDTVWVHMGAYVDCELHTDGSDCSGLGLYYWRVHSTGMNKVMTIRDIYIIYNPNSTGDARKNAVALQKQLRHHSRLSVMLKKTEYAGHAEVIACQIATRYKGDAAVLIISSSGDGGYNEVVNGVLSSENTQAITGVLPSGNANDHYHFVHHGDIVTRILQSKITSIDVLKVTTPEWTRYAHSYVGMGLTPQIGKELTKHTLNAWNQIWLVVRNYFTVRPVKIRHRGKVMHYNNIVFSNTGRMSKYLLLSKEASVRDGKFEITRTTANTFGDLTAHLLRAASKRIQSAPQATHFSFTCLRGASIQLDGEVRFCRAGQSVTVTCEARALKTIM